MVSAPFAALIALVGVIASPLLTPRAADTSLEDTRQALAAVRTRAAEFSKLYHDPVGPRSWIDSARLWYCTTSVDGARQWWLVDAAAQGDATRVPLFDHAEVAEAAQKVRGVNGGAVTADRLPIRQVKVSGSEVELVLEGVLEGIEAPLVRALPAATRIAADAPAVVAEVNSLPAPTIDAYELKHDGPNVVVRQGEREIHRTTDGVKDDDYSGGEWIAPARNAFLLMKVQRGARHRVRLVEASPADQLEPKLRTLNYTKPGDAIDAPMPHLFRVEADATAPQTLRVREIALDSATFANMWSIDFVRWLPASDEAVLLCNQRGHASVRLLALNLATGTTRVLADEHFATFVDYTNKIWMHWLDASNELLWMSERDGWNHLYLIDVASGAVKRQITEGNWLVRRVHHVDEQARTIDLALMGREPLLDPYQVHHARVNIDSSALTMLTAGNGTCRVDFSPDRSALVCVRASPDLPPVYEVRRASDGAVVVELGAGDARALRAAGWRWPQQFRAKGRDGVTDIYGLVYRPTNFDPAKKYPVIENIYAGPHDAHVPEWFGVWNRSREYAELGAIVVQIDGMGTNWRGKAFHDVCFKNLKDSGFPDRVAWIKALADTDASLDLTRVGIFGGSAGGQSAMRAVLDHADFYSVAAADCGCHDNRMDKIWWNEQWMGWPVDESYSTSSNLVDAAKLKGALMLSVGGLDENVDPATTMQVAQALIDAGKDFELLVIPDAGHGCAESEYGNLRRARFLFEKLDALPMPAKPAAPAPPAPPAPRVAATPPVPLASSTRPNIVFIMSDDHCKQAIACYGASAAPGLIATPGIDRIAREGIRFDSSSVTNAICGPSRAVMLTGKHSHANGFARNDQRFDNTQQTFPKLLQSAGYRTEVVGKWHLESAPTGFDHFDVLVGQGDYWNPTFLHDGVTVVREGHVTDVIHARAIERLDALAEGAKKGTPFALLLHHKAPHRNWMPQPRHLGMFASATIPEPATLFDRWTGRSRASALQQMQVDRDLTWEYDLKVPARELYPDRKVDPLDQWMSNELARLPQETRDLVRAAYRAENTALVAQFGAQLGSMDAHAQTQWKFQRYAKDYLRTAQGVDDSVGAILDELDRLGISENTIVIYTSDQGWYLGEHGWFDKRWMYEESFRMPLVLRWPAVVKAGRASSALVQNLDFAPTFLDAAGVAVPADMQGKSMLPLLRDAAASDRSASDAKFRDAEFRDAVYYRFEESKGPHTVPRHEGVATSSYKLIRFIDLPTSVDDPSPTLELYDLARDPDELTNCVNDPACAAIRTQLLARLEALRVQYGAPSDALPSPMLPSPALSSPTPRAATKDRSRRSCHRHRGRWRRCPSQDQGRRTVPTTQAPSQDQPR